MPTMLDIIKDKITEIKYYQKHYVLPLPDDITENGKRLHREYNLGLFHRIDILVTVYAEYKQISLNESTKELGATGYLENIVIYLKENRPNENEKN